MTMSELKIAQRKNYLDANQQIERIQIEGRDYVLMREPVFRKMLEEIEGLDSALDVQRAQGDANLSAARKLLAGKYTPAQIAKVFSAPTGGERIELLRRFQHMSQQELADRANVSQASVSKLENRKVQLRQVDTLRSVFGALDVPESAGFEILRDDAKERE
jgi:DNA-binding transcriptional regulator YiaG